MGKMEWWIAMDLMSGRAVPGGLLGGRRRRRRRQRQEAEAKTAAQLQAEAKAETDKEVTAVWWIVLIAIVIVGVRAPYDLGFLLARPDTWGWASHGGHVLQGLCGVVTLMLGMAWIGIPADPVRLFMWALGILGALCVVVAVATLTGAVAK